MEESLLKDLNETIKMMIVVIDSDDYPVFENLYKKRENIYLLLKTLYDGKLKEYSKEIDEILKYEDILLKKMKVSKGKIQLLIDINKVNQFEGINQQIINKKGSEIYGSK